MTREDIERIKDEYKRQQAARRDCISRQDFDKFLEDAEKEAAKNRRHVFASVLNTIRGNLRNFPSVQTETDQIRWERDTAIQQLNDLGYGLGEEPRTDSDAINRQAAIDIASGYCHPANIAKELAALPSVHPKFPANWWKTDHGYMWLCPHCGLPVHSDFAECLRCGIKRPSAQPEKKGKWISLDDFRGKYNTCGYKCSECGEYSEYEENFCSNCGVDMRGEQE